MNDVCDSTDASCFHQPLVHGGSDIASSGVDAAGKVDGVQASRLRGSVGALFGVVGALDDVAADAG